MMLGARRARRHLVFWAILLAGGAPACGSSSSPPPPSSPAVNGDPALETSAWRNGARLRAHVLDGGGGAKVFLNWIDTMTNIECVFARLGDGSFRCLPVNTSGGTSQDRYCPTPVAGDLSQYVPATETIDLTTRPLSARVLVAQDGARENAGLFDTVHMTPCIPIANEVAGTTDTTCVPPDVGLTGTDTSPVCPLTDPSCQSCAGAGFTATRDPNVPASTLACGVTFETFTFGTTITEANCGCPDTFVADSTYPAARTKRVGTGRLHVDLFTDSAGRLIINAGPRPDFDSLLRGIGGFDAPARAFFDDSLGAPCVAFYSSSGAPWCEPAPNAHSYNDPAEICHKLEYADAGCTIPAYVSGGCPPPGDCDGNAWLILPDAAYQLGATLAVTKAYAGAPGACAEDTSVDWQNPNAPVVARAVGPAVPVSTLAPLVEQTE
jgi:hypothetical protein